MLLSTYYYVQDGHKYARADAGMYHCGGPQMGAKYVQFIADIRGARVRELEEKRINKEMANIRKRFKGEYVNIALE